MGRIGHASLGSDGHAKNDAFGQGDQNGREVYIRNWYSKPWHTILRARDLNVAERMAKTCEDGCNNNNIGYDQNRRNSLRTEAVKTRFKLGNISVPCSTDCSAFMSVCAEASGVAMYGQYTNNNAPTTSNMVAKFYATGMFDVLTNSVYLKSDVYLRRGDILVGNGHTAMCLDNGSKQPFAPILSKGSKGAWVKELQTLLKRKGIHITIDSDFGQNTMNAVIEFQGLCHIAKDGVVGSQTWEYLTR